MGLDRSHEGYEESGDSWFEPERAEVLEPERTVESARVEPPEGGDAAGDGAQCLVDPETAQRRENLETAIRSGAGPERLPPEDVRGQIEWMRQGEGHACDRHRDLTDDQLAERAQNGLAETGDLGQPPRNASRFESDAALVRAEAAAWDSPQAVTDRAQMERDYRHGLIDRDATYVSATIPAETALGPDWREHVYGRSRDSGGKAETDFGPDTKVRTIWEMGQDDRWYCLTCYPRP